MCTVSQESTVSVGMVKRHLKVLDKGDFMVIYETYISPHLDYCLQVWSPWLQKDIECLERIQKRLTKLVKGFKKMKYNERLKWLGLYTLEKRGLQESTKY